MNNDINNPADAVNFLKGLNKIYLRKNWIGEDLQAIPKAGPFKRWIYSVLSAVGIKHIDTGLFKALEKVTTIVQNPLFFKNEDVRASAKEFLLNVSHIKHSRLKEEKWHKINIISNLLIKPHALAKEDTSVMGRELDKIAARDITTLKDKDGNTPLHFAAANMRPDIIKPLVEPRKKKNEPKSLSEFKNNLGNTPWHVIAMERHDSLKGERLEEILELMDPLLNEGENPWLDENDEGMTPIHYAAQNRNMTLLSALFAPFSNRVLTEALPFNGGDATPAHLLILNHQEVSHMSPPQRKHEGDRIGKIFTYIAATHPEVLEALDKDGKSPLDYAKALIEERIDIPLQTLYCLEHPQEVCDMEKGVIKKWKKAKTVMEKKLSRWNDLSQEEQNQFKSQCVPSDNPRKFDLDINKKRLEKIFSSPELDIGKGNNVWHYLANKDSPVYQQNKDDIAGLMMPKEISELLCKPNSEKITPLHVALQTGNVHFFEVLLASLRRDPNISLLYTTSLSDFLYHVIRVLSDPNITYELSEDVLTIFEMLIAESPSLISSHFRAELDEKLANSEDPEDPKWKVILSLVQNAGRANVMLQLKRNYEDMVYRYFCTLENEQIIKR